MKAEFSAKALLFDFDGTIVDSSVFYDRVWTQWAERRGIDPAPLLAIHHGRRFGDTLQLAGHTNIDIPAAGRELYAMSHETCDGLALVSGVRDILEMLPTHRWAIVTSSGETLVRSWLEHFRLPQPPVLVTAEMVARGKPAPDCFLAASVRLAMTPADCIVFEDAPAGIEAAQAAGARVIALATTHRGRLPSDVVAIDDFTRISASAGDDGLALTIPA